MLFRSRLATAGGKAQVERERRLDRAIAHLKPGSILASIESGGRQSADLGRRLVRAGAHITDRAKTDLGRFGQLLDSYSYERVLDRGFVLVRDRTGAPVTLAAELKSGERISLRFADGERTALAEGEAPKRKAKAPVGQGTLI